MGRRAACALVALALAAALAACGSSERRTIEPVTDTAPDVSLDPSGTIGGTDPDTGRPATAPTTTTSTSTADAGGAEAGTVVDVERSGGTEAPEGATTTPDGGGATAP